MLTRPSRRLLDDLAAGFARRHGSFTLYFDAAQNHMSPDYVPWTLMLAGDDSRSWGNFTAEGVIKFADVELTE
jgi:hypothetical protein